MITRSRAYLDNSGAPSVELLGSVCSEFMQLLPRLNRLGNYADGKHAILSRMRTEGLPNVRIVCDMPGYIAKIASGYLVGQPVTYSAPEQEAALDQLMDAYRRANVASLDAELAMDASVYGRAVCLCYANAEAQPRAAQIDPKTAFVVYDDTVEHSPMFGVHIVKEYNAQGMETGVLVTVYTERDAIVYRGTGFTGIQPVKVDPHYFGGVPMVEFWNNSGEKGDFEGILALIDAYDELQSDRVNDKEQFVDSLLVMQGVMGFAPMQSSADEDEQKDDRNAAQRLREDKVLTLPEGADVKWLDHQLDESAVEVLRKSMVDDMHKFAMVPDLTDEHFASNASGVAMKYKLFGLEQLTKTKERWFSEGLRSRLRLMAAFLAVKGAPRLDAEEVSITFTRALPSNDLEIAQTIATLKDIVPDAILMAQVPFVEDADQAMALMQEQKEEAAKAQQAAFTPYADGNMAQKDDEP